MSRFLIVDDNEQNLYMLQALLKGHGYEVIQAGDGAEALAVARSDPPDMVISDILMPGMDGFALCREWKKDDQLRGIPFVFYTATYTDPKDEQFALSLGVERFVVKPAEPDVLVGILQEVLEDYEAGRLVATEPPVEEEAVYFKEYNQVLIRKLEDKLADLEEANRALRESEERCRLLLDSTAEAIYGLDFRGNCTFCNTACLRLLGYTDVHELLGRNMHQLIHHTRPDGAPYPDQECRIYRAFRQGEGVHVDDEVLWRADATCFPAEYWSYPVRRGEELVGAVVTFLDITERKQMAQELVRLERLRALGEMSAGVSHNLNNILTSVLGPAQLLLRTTDDFAVRRDAESIIRATRRARDLVHRLHLSTRGVEEDELRSVQVNEVLQDAIGVTRPRWKDAPESRGIVIEVVTELADVPPIRGTESRLHDIFVNLILNAVDAMPAGGTLTIRTRAAEENVRITVTDTGIGMDKETRRRVFEPFFTTKADVGSGLGLSTAYGAVATWGGDIDVESEPGKGTTFTILLPVWTGPEVEPDVKEQAARRRRAKLLVVEDDEGVCEFLSRLLGKDHEVETALSGQEALDRFAPGQYDVALIDQAMPGIPGDRVAREMRREDASLATVLITGWEFSEDDPRLSVYDLRIQKPFDDLDVVVDVIAQAVALHDRRAEGRD